MNQGNSYGIIIQARSNASRLPGKMTMPFYDEKTILELLLMRLKQAITHYPIYVATSKNKADDAIQKMANNLGVPVFRGDETNVLMRMLDAAHFFKISNVIRVCADNPFLNVNSILTLIETHKNDPVDYISFEVGDNTPAILSHFGFYAELVKTAALQKALSTTANSYYLEHVTNYVYTHPEEFLIKFIKAPANIYNRTDLRLTVDRLQDFEIAQKIFSVMIKNDFSQEELVNFIDSNSEIKSSMLQMIEQNRK